MTYYPNPKSPFFFLFYGIYDNYHSIMNFYNAEGYAFELDTSDICYDKTVSMCRWLNIGIEFKKATS